MAENKKKKNEDATVAEPEGKKHHTLRNVVTIIIVIIIIGAAMSGSDDSSDSTDTTTPETEILIDATEDDTESRQDANETATENETEIAAESEPETEPETETDIESKTGWDAGALSYLNMSRDDLLAIYTDYDELLDSYDGDPDASGDVIKAFEDSCAEQVAEEYDLSVEDVNQIYIYACVPGYFATFDLDNVELSDGELRSVTVNGSTIGLQVKIDSSWTTKLTIERNYYIVCDFIRDYAGTDYTSISYAAWADMTNGKEEKVVSFEVPSYMIELIATQDFADNTLGDYVENLWLHQSLRDE